MTELVSTDYQEKHRPQFHFSPAKNWMNDPNGLIYFKGRYHLFYQHNPFGDQWGNMSWGHASSADLMHWQHHPLAIQKGSGADEHIFSGCIVHDAHNCSGLGATNNGPLLAFFTFSGEQGQNQRQAVAYSEDDGLSWSMYEDNPVIGNPGVKDFRDPKVFWHEPSRSWVMLLAAAQGIEFFKSDNLLDWQLFHRFGDFVGMHGGDWECPDLFPLHIEGSEQTKWVMLVSVSPGAPNGGCATQYFIGEFDGKAFIPDTPNSNWIDWGPDSFAGATWNTEPGRAEKVYIAWMSNWIYADKTPTSSWRGQMTFPRCLSLRENNGSLSLASRPIKGLEALTQSLHSDEFTGQELTGAPVPVPETFVGQLDLHVLNQDTLAGFKLFNESGEAVLVLVDSFNQRLIVDRSRTHHQPSFPQFAYSYYAELKPSPTSTYDITWLKDTSSIEVFVNDGGTTMTALIYTDKPLTHLETILLRGHAEFQQASINTIASVW